jgi:hypothetical protein
MASMVGLQQSLRGTHHEHRRGDRSRGSARQEETGSWGAFARRAAVFVFCCALVWVGLFWIDRSFPYVRNGSLIVERTKRGLIARPPLAAGPAVRIPSFGNSKILAGLKPDVFNRVAAPEAASFNMAIPGEPRSVDLLESLLVAGSRPTQVLVQELPPDPSDQSWLSWLHDDKMIIDWLFPFRQLPRDAAIFAFLNSLGRQRLDPTSSAG